MSASTSLPIEILDHILSHIDEPADLVPSLLVSKPLNALADNHIQCRVIRCPLGLIGLWDHLSQTPSRAEKVRVLEIKREPTRLFNNFGKLAPTIVPREFVEDAKVLYGDGAPYLEWDPMCHSALINAERALIRALKTMSGLQVFKWGRTPPLIDSRLDDVPDDIWTALQRCPNVTEVEVLDFRGKYVGVSPWYDSDPADYGPIRRIHNSLMFTTLTNLTRFVYKTTPFHSTTAAPLEAMVPMLLCCPNMEHLDLNLSLSIRGTWLQHPDTIDLSSLFIAVQFKALHTLYLAGVHSSPSAAVRFFTKHSTIQNLNIDEESSEFIRAIETPFAPALNFSGEVLPNLVTLQVPPQLAFSILNHPVSAPRPLYRLGLTFGRWDWYLYTNDFLQALRRHPALYELDLVLDPFEPAHLLILAPALPGIRVIRVSMAAASDHPEKSQGEWIDAVSAIPTLEILTGVPILTHRQHPALQARDVAELMARCPRLRQIQRWSVGRLGGYKDVFLRDAAGEPILRPRVPRFRAFWDHIQLFGLRARHASRRLL